MNNPLSRLTIAELKEEFIQQSQLLTAAIDAGEPIEKLDEIRHKMIAVIDQLHAKALETKNETQKH